MQFASIFLLGSSTVALSEPLAFAQDVCALREEASVTSGDADQAEGWPCGADLSGLDLTVPAPSAAALSGKPKDMPAKLPDETVTAAPLPFEITPAESGAKSRASLQSLRNFHVQKQARKVQDLTASPGAAISMPKPAATSAGPLDLWTKLDAQGFDGGDGRMLKSGAGLDYRVIETARIGFSAERAEKLADSGTAAATAEDKVSAYVAFRALPALTIDARGNWSSTQMSGPASTAAGEKASVAVAPRLAKSFTLESGETLAPYVEVKHQIDLGSSALGTDATGVANSAAAGVTLAKPDSYSVSVSADVSEAGASEAPNISSKVQLKLPLD